MTLHRRLQCCLVLVTLLAAVGCGKSAVVGSPQPVTNLDLPQQILLSSSMRERPVPGWKVTIEQLGLPPDSGVLPLDNAGDRAVFLVVTERDWSVLGIDIATGKRGFGPVPLGPADAGVAIYCYVNGPPTVLCVRDWPNPSAPSTAKVINSASGEVTYDGPTSIRADLRTDQPRIEQVGDYAVAVIEGKGVQGIGPRGQPTWFVPGDGILPTPFAEDSDSVAPTLTTQRGAALSDVVFSAADGSVVKPELPQDVQLGSARVYPGGFAYEYTVGDDYATERVAFFDDAGRKVAEPEPGGTLTPGSVDLPVVKSTGNYRLFTIGGRQLLELPPTPVAPAARLIGSQWYYATDGERTTWQQVDLRTGDAGRTCTGLSLSAYYIASDGEVVIARDDRTLAQAVDPATCETLWRIDGSQPGEVTRLWRVNTTLVQRTNDTLFSLVAPS